MYLNRGASRRCIKFVSSPVTTPVRVNGFVRGETAFSFTRGFPTFLAPGLQRLVESGYHLPWWEDLGKQHYIPTYMLSLHFCDAPEEALVDVLPSFYRLRVLTCTQSVVEVILWVSTQGVYIIRYAAVPVQPLPVGSLSRARALIVAFVLCVIFSDAIALLYGCHARPSSNASFDP